MMLGLIGMKRVISLKKLKSHPKNVQISPKKLGGGGGGVATLDMNWLTHHIISVKNFPCNLVLLPFKNKSKIALGQHNSEVLFGLFSGSSDIAVVNFYADW